MESFLDRVRYDLDRLSRRSLQIWVEDATITYLIARAAVGCGFRNITLVGGPAVKQARDAVEAHIGYNARVRALSPAVAVQFRGRGDEATWIIDAGIAGCGRVIRKLATEGPVLYLARENGPAGGALVAGAYHPGCLDGLELMPIRVSPVCGSLTAHLITWALTLAGAMEAAPPPSSCRMPLRPLAPGLSWPGVFEKPFTILIPGGGGAIGHAFLDCLRQVPQFEEERSGHCQPLFDHPNAKFILVDPGVVHASAVSRQIFYSFAQARSAAPKAEATAAALRRTFPRAETITYNEAVSEALFDRHPKIDFCVWSVDTWFARRLLSRCCSERGIPFISAGSHHDGGMARLVHHRNQYCLPPETGVEGLGNPARQDPPGALADRTSCAYRPAPSSILPNLAVASHMVHMLLDHLAIADWDRVDPALAVSLARGVEVHLLRDSEEPGYERLRHSPGRLVSVRDPR